ncbi:hypothetical protein Y032_0498g2512 [Ancylostoma ceylanicum]|uniref:Uncharacterized protein n=1 Tax=Ancylostoma ceylanicum TaxID=53326 RepID=A0A016WUH6_9BILA|nr:hypothetical protein Y032_0498g2512 [Ancylostoma ceylanicum]
MNGRLFMNEATSKRAPQQRSRVKRTDPFVENLPKESGRRGKDILNRKNAWPPRARKRVRETCVRTAVFLCSLSNVQHDDKVPENIAISVNGKRAFSLLDSPGFC